MESEDGPQLQNYCNDFWSWSTQDKSHEVLLIDEKNKTARFHPDWSNGSAGIRGTRALNKGCYYWEIKVIERIFGTSMMFGIGTKKARLHINSFVNMLGEDKFGWGLSHKGLLWHNGKWRQYTQPFKENETTTVGILFDGLNGTLTYYKDGSSLGVAFTDLHLVKDELYPIVCSTAAKTEMTLGVTKREFCNLQDRCRSVIINSLQKEVDVTKLRLPKPIKKYLIAAFDGGLGSVISALMAMESEDGPQLQNYCNDFWSWSSQDKSHEVLLIDEKNKTAQFHPDWSNGTAGIRGTRALNRGCYYWEINATERIYGTSMMFGIGTKKARLHINSFVDMLGEDEFGWGLSHQGLLWHNGKSRQYAQPFQENVATTVGLLFDGLNGTLTYYKDGSSLGVAFTDLHLVKDELYPIVCSTAAKTEMTLGVTKREFCNLQDRCRSVIINSLQKKVDVTKLRLPKPIKKYVIDAFDGGLGRVISAIMAMESEDGPQLQNYCNDFLSWSKRDKSHEVHLIYEKNKTARFHPYWSNGTAGIRGTRALNRGRYYWEINVTQRIFGTSMMFGIGTKKARLHIDSLINMLGEDEFGWGLSHEGLLWHNGKWRQYAKPFRESEATTVGLLFDGLNGTLTYYKDGSSLGVAFTDLHLVKDELYPIACSTVTKTEMTLGVTKQEFCNLQNRCRSVIINYLQKEADVRKLRLPEPIKKYLIDAFDVVNITYISCEFKSLDT